MKKNLMRILSLGMAVFLLFGLLPCVFATEEQEGSKISTHMSDEEASTTADPLKADTKNSNPEGYVYKSGIIWGADSSKEFDAVYNGKKNHVYCVSTHNVKHNGSYVPCYCIDPGNEIGTGTPYDDYLLTTNDAWNSLSNQQRRAIGLALIYGYPNSINPSSFLDKKGAQAATQMIIWEICYGMRNSYHPYSCTDNRYYNLFESDSVGHEFTDGGTGANNGWIHNMKAVYQQISDKMAQHYTRPSFLSTDSSTAQIFDLAPTGNGTYSVTLTDSNNMLSAINFTNTDNLTFAKNGNTLTITANKPATEVTVKATKNVPNLEAQTFIVWKHTDKQMIVEPVSPTSDPTSLYLKLRVRTGNLSIKKTTSDGKMLEGWQFILYSDQACTNKVYGPYTTASDGTNTANNLTAGTYWIKEVGNTDPDVQARYKCEGENPRKITVTAGQTTNVAFNNVLQTGNLSIKKTTSDGEMLGGWKFTIYSDQACTKKVYGPYTTATNGSITAKDLLAETYWIREEGNVDPKVDKLYKCQGENPRKITLTAGQTVSVAFSNVKQIGAVKIVKKTNTGGTLANWKIGIYTDEACTKPISGSPFVTGTDGTITVPNLMVGTYYAKEVDESAQYPYWKFDTEVKKVTVETGKTASVTFTNTQYGKLRIKKNAVNGTPKDWKFEILNESKEVIATLTTNREGYASSDLLLPGKYYVREIHDRDETYWTYDAKVEKEAVVTAGEDVTVEYTNEQFGRISFHKTTDSGKYLEGWVFRATDETGNFVGEYTTDETGFAVTEKLKPGKYFVKEVARNDPYWVVNVETHTVDAMAGRTVRDEWHNREYGKGTFRKVTNTGTNLEGWQLTIYSDAECQNVVAVVTTDADGAVSHMLALGLYYVKETGDTKGRLENGCWTIDTAVRIIIVRPHEEATVTFQNELYGKISVQKVSSDRTPLSKVEFCLEWSKDGNHWEPIRYQKNSALEGSCSNREVVEGKLTTDKDGVITWERLHAHLYYRVTETKAPNGYVLLTEPAFEGKLPESDPMVTLKVVNARQFEMPQTGSASMLRMPIALLLCTLVCAGALFRLRKKKSE